MAAWCWHRPSPCASAMGWGQGSGRDFFFFFLHDLLSFINLCHLYFILSRRGGNYTSPKGLANSESSGEGRTQWEEPPFPYTPAWELQDQEGSAPAVTLEFQCGLAHLRACLDSSQSQQAYRTFQTGLHFSCLFWVVKVLCLKHTRFCLAGVS